MFNEIQKYCDVVNKDTRFTLFLRNVNCIKLEFGCLKKSPYLVTSIHSRGFCIFFSLNFTDTFLGACISHIAYKLWLSSYSPPPSF